MVAASELASGAAENVITKSTRGEQVEIGQLYNARTGGIIPSISLWRLDDIKAGQEVVSCPDTTFDFTTSMKDLRKHHNLDAEGSVEIDFGIFALSGSAQYLKNTQHHEHEARVDVSCTVVKHRRYMPMELLKNMKFQNFLDDPRLSMDWEEGEEEDFEGTDISVRGAIKETVGTIEGAARVGKELPTKLSELNNSLKMVLLPLSFVDSEARRVVTRLDARTMEDVSAALETAEGVHLSAESLCVAVNAFPCVETQRRNFATAFNSCIITFRTAVRGLVPKLRDGDSSTTDEDTLELQHAVDRMTRQTKLAIKYVELKNQESAVLASTVNFLLETGFANYMDPVAKVQPAIGSSKPRILLSLAGKDINNPCHKLETSLTCDAVAVDGDSVENKAASFDAEYGVGIVNKGIPFWSTDEKMKKTEVGDLVLFLDGRVRIISKLFPGPPDNVKLRCNEQTMHVQWEWLQQDSMPPRSFRVLWRPRPNADLDTFDQSVDEYAAFEWKDAPAGVPYECVPGAQGGAYRCELGPLGPNTDFEVCVQTCSDVGFSARSPPNVKRTGKLPSAARDIIAFYHENMARLELTGAGGWIDKVGGKKPWESTEDSLFLGSCTVARRARESGKFAGKLAAIMADVASDFKPEITLGPEQEARALVLMFAGPTGAGKSTEINAFVSFLLGGDLADTHRIMLIDDRAADPTQSVTQRITVYRLRPLGPRFQGHALYIVDTPGYGDCRGHEADNFTTAAMAELFKMIEHVNAAVFTCKANEGKTSPSMVAVATHIFQLFSKDVHGCLRAVLTHADAGAPQAVANLKALGWPVDKGYAQVNNSAFRAQSTTDANVRDWWKMSMSGQKRALDMLLRMEPVSTRKSTQVTTKRMTLEERCELAEKKIFRTAQETQSLLANLRAIAEAVGASPGETVRVSTVIVREEPVPDGDKTTLCLECHVTCHEICAFDDGEKHQCIAMDESGHCKIRPKKCHYSKHRNAMFILRPETQWEDIVPEDLINRWNKNNNSIEGAVLGAMDKYLALQDELADDIRALAALADELHKTALLHDPERFLKYLDTLIASAKARGASSEQLQALMSAKNTMKIAARAASAEGYANAEPELLARVTRNVRGEMKRRTQMGARARAKEEGQPCDIYNKIYKSLPAPIREKAPGPVAEAGWVGKGAKWPENLKAIVKLMDVILQTGCVIGTVTAD
ncbi:unnamed protein product [Prorocentrum cordatum]|uniref:Fibronectin type-III domain-containing protein n=1 Tax=Prorocentrum cordatum TaxID=2364126 RepID=A0ABN9RFV0_9DINO|nr:unnamed protein product [Polarella glacialis]